MTNLKSTYVYLYNNSSVSKLEKQLYQIAKRCKTGTVNLFNLHSFISVAVALPLLCWLPSVLQTLLLPQVRMSKSSIWSSTISQTQLSAIDYCTLQHSQIPSWKYIACFLKALHLGKWHFDIVIKLVGYLHLYVLYLCTYMYMYILSITTYMYCRSFLIQFTPKLQNFVYSQVITAPCPGSDRSVRSSLLTVSLVYLQHLSLSLCSVRLCVPSATRQDCLINIAVNRSRTVDLLNTEYTFGSRNLIRLPNTNLPTTAEVSHLCCCV